MRSLLFLSPHFPPDSAAGTHRARILTPHLTKFGWRPTVLTVEPDSVEGAIDPELGEAMDQNVRVVRVKAWPAKVTRRVGFGDLGLRAYRPMRREAMSLARRQRPDVVLVTTYPTYPAMIGAAMKRTLGVPFVLDLQDPWVGAWGKDVGPGGAPDLRSRASRALATQLEHKVATSADALMSVTTQTMTELAARVPAAAAKPMLEVPIGFEPADWARVRRDGMRNLVFDPDDGCYHLCAVGTLLPTASDGLEAFLNGVAQVIATAGLSRRLRVWFVGTSNESRADAPSAVAPSAERLGLRDFVAEHPPRLAYFDALRVLRDAHAVLVLGSAEPHYTPSRVFPALASRRPIIARLHRASSAWELLAGARASRPIELIDSTADLGRQSHAFAAALTKLMQCSERAPAIDDRPLAKATGEALAERVAAFLDQVCTS